VRSHVSALFAIPDQMSLQAASYEALADPAYNVWETLRSMPGMEHGLAPIFVNPGASKYFEDLSSATAAAFSSNHVSLGARGDSFYEYMLKQYLLGGKKDNNLLEMYTEAMRGVRDVLLAETAPGIYSKCPMGKTPCCRQPVSVGCIVSNAKTGANISRSLCEWVMCTIFVMARRSSIAGHPRWCR
jgi:hypothetical protein